jgi:hypothetical protein
MTDRKDVYTGGEIKVMYKNTVLWKKKYKKIPTRP